MNKLILLTAILLCTLNVYAAKTYDLKVKIQSLATHEPLEGFTVSTIIKNVKNEVGRTDKNGEFVIASISEKSFDVVIEDPEGKYRNQTLYYFNSKKVDEEKEILLRLKRNEEELFFKAVDAKYVDSTGVLVNQIPSGKSSLSDKDSIDFNPASPQGGVPEFYKFIAMNIEYPQDCIEKNIQGKVYISFIVQVDGTITNVVVEKGVNPSLDQEACRLIRYSSKWNPASSNGKPVRALVKTPVNFTLN
jgi:TonB family protein